MGNDQHPDKIKWNKKYAEKGLDSFEIRPAEWLRAHQPLLEGQEKGAALDLACGNGRHAFYLAQLGFEVDAVDISDVAISWLTQQARQQNLAVNPKIMDLSQDPLPEETYQVIVCFNYLERCLFPAIQQALVPRGLLFFETVYRDDIAILGSKMNPRFVLDYNELLNTFLNLRVLEYREQILYSQTLQKERAYASLIARKV